MLFPMFVKYLKLGAWVALFMIIKSMYQQGVADTKGFDVKIAKDID